jgi:flavin-dependent dehydrogenase
MPENLDKEVIIVGAGISGCYAAYLAAEKGYEVTIYETIDANSWTNDILRGRRCGEGIWQKKLTNAGIHVDLESLPEWVENFTTTLHLSRVRRNKKIDTIQGRIEPYLFLNRQIFEDSLLTKARENGAEIRLGKEIRSINEIREKYPDSYILCAWGTNHSLTEQIVSGNFPLRYLLTYQHTLTGVNSNLLDNAKGICLSDDPLVRYFYIFPKSKDNSAEANVGVVFNKYRVPSPYNILNDFIELNPRDSLSDAKIIEGRTFGKILCAGSPITFKRLVKVPEIIPLGDAFFAVSSVSGGGIGHALLTSKTAVESLSTDNPQREYYKRLQPLIKKLEMDVSMAQILFPPEGRTAKEINDKFLKIANEQLTQGGYLPLSNIVKNFSK